MLALILFMNVTNMTNFGGELIEKVYSLVDTDVSRNLEWSVAQKTADVSNFRRSGSEKNRKYDQNRK